MLSKKSTTKKSKQKAIVRYDRSTSVQPQREQETNGQTLTKENIDRLKDGKHTVRMVSKTLDRLPERYLKNDQVQAKEKLLHKSNVKETDKWARLTIVDTL